MIRLYSFTICLAIFLLNFDNAPLAQPKAPGKNPVLVIKTLAGLEKTIAQDSAKLMTSLEKELPGVLLDLKYTTDDNFFHSRLYPVIHTSFLRRAVVIALAAVQKELNAKGFGLKIWDAYRPYSVTKKMWEIVKDTRYAADPKSGSNHNRGIAIDLTIVDIKTHAALDMGTGFDNFTDSAHHNFKNFSQTILANRAMLRSIMEEHGFTALETEWWHYYFKEAANFELLDISFRSLDKLSAQKHIFE